MLLQLTGLLFLLTLLSGISLIGTPPHHAHDSAAIAWLHVVIGWVALPVFVAFTANHTYERWQRAARTRRQSGAMGIATLALLVFSGIEIGEKAVGMPTLLARQLHLWSTFGFITFLAVHLWPLVRRRLRRSSRSS